MLIIEELSRTNNSFNQHIDTNVDINNEEDFNNFNDAVFAANVLKTYLKDSVRVLTSVYKSSIRTKNIDGIDDILTTFKWFLDDEEPIAIKDKDISEMMKPSSICKMFGINHKQLYHEILTLYNIRKDSLIHQMYDEISEYRLGRKFKALDKFQTIEELYDIYEVYFFDNFDKVVDEEVVKKVWYYFNTREVVLKNKSIKLRKTRSEFKNNAVLKLKELVTMKNQHNTFLSSTIALNAIKIMKIGKRKRRKKNA